MVTAYVHLLNPLPMETLQAAFSPDDLVDIARSLPNAYVLRSPVLKPLEMRDILLHSLPKEPFVFVNAQRIDQCFWLNGDAPQSK